jgi:hypothetical protein
VFVNRAAAESASSLDSPLHEDDPPTRAAPTALTDTPSFLSDETVETTIVDIVGMGSTHQEVTRAMHARRNDGVRAVKRLMKVKIYNIYLLLSPHLHAPIYREVQLILMPNSPTMRLPIHRAYQMTRER